MRKSKQALSEEEIECIRVRNKQGYYDVGKANTEMYNNIIINTRNVMFSLSVLSLSLSSSVFKDITFQNHPFLKGSINISLILGFFSILCGIVQTIVDMRFHSQVAGLNKKAMSIWSEIYSAEKLEDKNTRTGLLFKGSKSNSNIVLYYLQMIFWMTSLFLLLIVVLRIS